MGGALPHSEWALTIRSLTRKLTHGQIERQNKSVCMVIDLAVTAWLPCCGREVPRVIFVPAAEAPPTSRMGREPDPGQPDISCTDRLPWWATAGYLASAAEKQLLTLQPYSQQSGDRTNPYQQRQGGMGGARGSWERSELRASRPTCTDRVIACRDATKAQKSDS